MSQTGCCSRGAVSPGSHKYNTSITAVNARGYSFGPRAVRLKLPEMFFRPTTKSL